MEEEVTARARTCFRCGYFLSAKLCQCFASLLPHRQRRNPLRDRALDLFTFPHSGFRVRVVWWAQDGVTRLADHESVVASAQPYRRVDDLFVDTFGPLDRLRIGLSHSRPWTDPLPTEDRARIGLVATDALTMLDYLERDERERGAA